MRWQAVIIGVPLSLLALGSAEQGEGGGGAARSEPLEERVEQWARATAEAHYGGMWFVDDELFVGFTDDPVVRRQRLDTELHVRNVQIARVARSLQTMQDIVDALSSDGRQFETLGAPITGVGIRPDRNVVLLWVRGNTRAAKSYVERQYPAGSIEVHERDYLSHS